MSPLYARGDWMQTNSGGRYYPMDPRPEDIEPRDIAHALSLLCRYGGHVDRFYSVAEHCVLMSEAVAPEHALYALLHVATEAYVVDVLFEALAWDAIANRFGLPTLALPEEVKDADNAILLTERNALMPRAGRWSQDDDYEPLAVTVTGWPPEEAERRYLDRLAELTATDPTEETR